MTADEQALVARIREVAHLLYEGEQVAHRSCGVALAETFGLNPRPYLMLRRGGLTGEGRCGAMQAGELVLGELLSDDDPTAPASDTLRAAVATYRRLCDDRLDRGAERLVTCNDLLARLAVPFGSRERRDYCTGLAAGVAEIVAEVLLAHGVRPAEPVVPER